jgi:hypothetical protein
MGFYSAKQVVENSGGTVAIKSTENVGTSVSMSFPAPEDDSVIQIGNDEMILVIDDQPTALSSWRLLFERDLPEARDRVRLFSNPTEFLACLDSLEGKPLTAFCDFDLKTDVTGLDLAGRVGRNGRAYLVTGHSPDSAAVKQAGRDSVPVIFKSRFAQLRLRSDATIR